MELGAASDAGRAPRCDKEDGLPRRGTGSGWNSRPGMGGVNDHLGSPPATPVHQMPEGGCLPPDMANGKTGPAEERVSPVGLTVRYRPVCHLDEIGKLFERIIATRLEAHMSERVPGWHDSQYGFGRGQWWTRLGE